MIKIYHNNRCGKSRCALQEIEKLDKPFEVIEYLKNPPNAAELQHILALLGKRPFELVRQNEPVFQEKFRGKTFSDEEWIDILTQHPVLIQRPIVVAGEQAWIARDDDSLDDIAQL